MPRHFLFLLTMFAFPTWAQDLPRLGVDPNRTAVVGLSSGGIMAVQLGVAHSADFRGVGVFAGGIYGCGDTNITASGNCQTRPELPSVKTTAYLIGLQVKGLIDPVMNVSKQKIYLFRGLLDHVVPFDTMKALAEFYHLLGVDGNLKAETMQVTGHGFPTVQYGNKCSSSSSPWLINCGFDGADEALQQLFGHLNQNIEAKSERLHTFDQTRYAESKAMMAKQGMIYIPKHCEDGQVSCALLVALHGCGQAPEAIGPLFAQNAGFNEVAEANDIVVLYPAIEPSLFRNFAGCWDWWGYTGKRHIIDNEAPQIQAIMAMVNHLRIH